ncbi:MAG: hypothetical protein GX144_12865 [Clostridiaceae bacterium]|jgi:hypothetical protein|nr:hypothetical protein [Clostridiaceae bacterium]
MLYTYVSFAVVILSTVALLIIFHQKNLRDFRYHLGILISSVLACAGSLFFPKLISVFTVNMAIQFVVSLFVTILLYILLIFFVLILLFFLIPKQKIDDITEKWEERKAARNAAKALKRQIVNTENSEPNDELLEQAQDTQCSETTPQLQENTAPEIKPEEEEPQKQDEDMIQTEVDQPNISQTPDELETIEESLPDERNTTVLLEDEALSDEEQSKISSQMQEPERVLENDVYPENDEGPDAFEQKSSDTVPQDDQQQEITEKDDLLDEAAVSLADSLVNNKNIEKNVDTSDIIDKMRVDMSPEPAVDISQLNELSLHETIEKAFLLKQKGDEMEAAVLYTSALDKMPDDETAFWIVLDICVIYKNAGKADLAEDILLTYIEEFENLMSETVKDQILQSLYEN